MTGWQLCVTTWLLFGSDSANPILVNLVNYLSSSTTLWHTLYKWDCWQLNDCTTRNMTVRLKRLWQSTPPLTTDCRRNTIAGLKLNHTPTKSTQNSQNPQKSHFTYTHTRILLGVNSTSRNHLKFTQTAQNTELTALYIVRSNTVYMVSVGCMYVQAWWAGFPKVTHQWHSLAPPHVTKNNVIGLVRLCLPVTREAGSCQSPRITWRLQSWDCRHCQSRVAQSGRCCVWLLPYLVFFQSLVHISPILHNMSLL